MKHINLYFRILQLHVANNVLLEVYNMVLSKTDFGIDEEIKNSVMRRRLLRQKFLVELKELLEKIKADNKSASDKFLLLCLPFYAKSMFFINRFILKMDPDKCIKQEQSNISLYYTILYSSDLPKPVTDLLLKQKSEIEEYLNQDH